MSEQQFPNEMSSIRDFQAFHRWLDKQKDFNTDIFLNALLLSGEVGEVAQVLKQVHFMSDPGRNDGKTRTLAEALEEQRDNLGQELADCLAYILKLANYSGINLEEAYLKKMKKNMSRTWEPGKTDQ